MRNRRNYYRILHVQPDAPPEIIHMSYLTLMRRLRMHPDLGGDHWNATLINEAYATLKDPVRRATYDRTFRRPYPASSTIAERPALPSGASTPNLPSCAFCDTLHAAQAVEALRGRCDICRSPLHPADRTLRSDTARRALERVERAMPLTFSPGWSPQSTFTGTTEDLSISGLLFATGIELLVDERIRLDCTFCSAVGIVRHVNPGPMEDTWRVGLEFLTLLLHEPQGGIVSTRA